MTTKWPVHWAINQHTFQERAACGERVSRLNLAHLKQLVTCDKCNSYIANRATVTVRLMALFQLRSAAAAWLGQHPDDPNALGVSAALTETNDNGGDL